MSAMAKITEEQALVERFRLGDDSAFDRIVEWHSAEVAALTNRLLGWPGDVDDVVQDVFVAAFVNLKKFRGECRLRTWLFTITVNKCRSHRLRRRRYLRVRRLDDVDVAAGPDQDAERPAMDKETFSRVRRAVQVRLNRARTRLKEQLGDLFEEKS
jgi:RNA polymerase sigma-70 factor (ECF subfamily)